jgi:hypothetical protein
MLEPPSTFHSVEPHQWPPPVAPLSPKSTRYWSLLAGTPIHLPFTNISRPRGVILKGAGRQSVLLQQDFPSRSKRCEYMSWARTGFDPIAMTASAHASEALERIAAPILSVPEKRGRTRFWERPRLAQRAALHNGRQTATARVRWRIERRNDGGRLRRQPPPPPRSGPIVARSDPSASRLPQAGAIGLAQARQRVAITSHAFVLVLTLRKRRTPIYAAPGTALPVGSSREVRSAFRRCEGASPVQRLKACVKALASWKPRSQAMCEIESAGSSR